MKYTVINHPNEDLIKGAKYTHDSGLSVDTYYFMEWTYSKYYGLKCDANFVFANSYKDAKIIYNKTGADVTINTMSRHQYFTRVDK